MFDRLAELETELEKLEARLSEIYASGDQNAAREAGRRHAELKPIVDAYRAYRATEADLADAREMRASEDDAEMREYLDTEIDAKDALLTDLDVELRELLIPRDPDAGRNVMVEIRGG
jgi:peptide chain release factor 1